MTGKSDARRALLFEVADTRGVTRWLERRSADDGLRLDVPPASAPAVLDQTFLDTEDRRLHRAGLQLFVQYRDGRDGTLRCSPIPREQDDRPEPRWAQPWRGGVERIGPGDGLGAVERRVACLTRGRPLHPWMVRQVQRRTLRVLRADRTLAEIELVTSRIHDRDPEHPFVYHAVRVVPGAGDAATAFVDAMAEQCGMRPGCPSPYRRGLAMLAVELPDLVPWRPRPFRADDSVAVALYEILREQTRRMLSHEAGTRLGEEIEELHRMRVAIRRMRAALAMFRDRLPPELRELAAELRWAGRALGDVRDLDVQRVKLARWAADLPDDERAALASVETLLGERRDRARETLLADLDSGRYDALATRLVERLAADPPAAWDCSREPIGHAAREVIRSRHRRVRKAAKRISKASPAGAYHRVRIRIKALRYALEFHRELYGSAADGTIRALVRVQDVLGDHQDADVALGWLRALGLDAASNVPPRARFVLGRLAQLQETEAARLRRRFRRRSGKLADRRWKALDAELDAVAESDAVRRRHLEMPAPEPPAAAGRPSYRIVPAKREQDAS